MEDLSKYSTEELEAMLQDSPQPQSAQPSQTQAPQATQEPASDMPDLSQYSTEALERMIGEQGTAEGRIEQMFNVGTDRRDEIDPLEEAAKGAGRAVKAIGGAFVGLGSGAVRLAGTPVRALTGWDGLHRVADSIDSGYEDWGSEALASELPDDDWGRVLGGFGEKMAGTAGSLGAMAAGGGLAKLGAAGKFGAASKAVGTAGAALQKSLPLIFGNDAAVRTYDTAKENGSGTARALGLASVNGAIHYFGFKAFENQSLNKMLGMPQEMGAMMPAWANAAMAKNAAGNTFTSLASGVRNGMYKYILAERAKGALKAGGIMGLQNFLSSVPTQMAEGAGVGDVDWGRAVSEGVGGVEEGALMEALMGGAAALKTPKAARKFISETLFRKGWKASNGENMPGLLHSPEGRAFVMKQNPEMQRRILDILDHGGKVTKGELNAACLPPDMTEAELREFAKNWKHDLEVDGWRKGEDEFLGDGEELTGSEDVRGQNAATTAAVEEERIAEEAMNADAPRNEPAPPIDAAREERAEPLSAAEAEAQQRQLNDAAERNRAEQVARDAEPRIAALRQTRQESSEMGNRLEHQFDEANAQADAERNGAEQLAREEAYPRITVEQAQAARTESSPVANGGAGTVLQEQIQRRIDAEARSEAGKKVQAEIDGFFDAVKGNRDVLGNEDFNARNADILAEVDDAIRRNNPQMARDALNRLKKKVKNFAKKNRLRPATPEPPPEPPDGSEPSGGSKSNLLRKQQPRSATQSTNSLRPSATQDELNQQPKEKPNETGNVPVEAQPEPAVQDAGRGGQQQAPQAAERPVEVAAPRGEVPAAGEVAEARPAEAKPVAPAPAATQEPKPAEPNHVSKSDGDGQKLTGEVSSARDTPTSKPLSEMTNDELLSAITAIDADGKMEPDAYKKAIKPYKDEIARRNAIGRGVKPDEANDVQITENVSKRTMDDAFGDFIDENGKPKTISQLIDNGWRVEKARTGAASRYRLVKDGVDGVHDLSSKKIKGRMRPGNYAWNIEAATKYSDSAEPPKSAPASAPRAEGTTTPPQSADAPQGAESAAGGAAGGAVEEPKPTQGNKLRKGGGKKGKKLEAQAEKTPEDDGADSEEHVRKTLAEADSLGAEEDLTEARTGEAVIDRRRISDAAWVSDELRKRNSRKAEEILRKANALAEAETTLSIKGDKARDVDRWRVEQAKQEFDRSVEGLTDGVDFGRRPLRERVTLLKKPLVVDVAGGWDEADADYSGEDTKIKGKKVSPRVKAEFKELNEGIEMQSGMAPDGLTQEVLLNFAKEHGFDGVVIQGLHDPNDHSAWSYDNNVKIIPVNGESPENPVQKKRSTKLRTQAEADAAKQATQEAPAAPATQEATPEATAIPAPASDEQTQPASKFRDKNGQMKKTLRGAVERIASAIGNSTGKGAITPEEADGIVNGIAESPDLKHNRTRQFFTPLVTDSEWQNSLGVDAESSKNLRDAVVRARDASQQKKQQRKLDNALRAADAGDKDAPTAYGLVRIASDALDKARTKGDKAAEARAQKALDDANAKFNAEYEQVPEANREKWVKEQEKRFEEWSKKHDDVARNESVTADAPIQGKDGSSTTMAEQLPAKSTNRVEKRRYAKGYVGEIKGVDGDEVHIAYYDADGKFMREEKVPLSTLRERGKILKQYKKLADAVEAKGEDAESTSVRFERAAPESPVSRDAKFAADADYQRWLKSRKANDAEPLRQRYEMEQAKALGDAFKNAVRGVDVEYVGDRDYDPAKDNPKGGRELKDRDTGTVLGIFDRDTGKLKLFRGANWKTLNHELGGHATMRFAEQEAARGNRALLDKINESIDNAPQWLKDEVKSRYPDADEATLRDEIWAALRERPSEAMQKYVKTLQGRRWYNRAWDAIKTAWRGILSRMGFNRADLSGIDKMTPDEFNEFLDKAMIGGKTLGRIETASPQSSVRMARGPAAPGGSLAGKIDMAKDESLKEKYLRNMSDRYDPLKRLVEEARKGAAKPDDVPDPYHEKRVQSGHNEADRHQIDVLKNKYVDFLKRHSHGQKEQEKLHEEVNMYLRARDALYRNPEMKKRLGVDDGSGMSDAKAHQILDDFKRRMRTPILDEAFKIMQEVKKTYGLQRLVDGGMLDQATATMLESRNPDYAPQRTSRLDEEGIDRNSTRNMEAAAIKKALGRSTLSDNPVEFLFMQASDAAARTNENRTRLEMAKFVRMFPEVGKVRTVDKTSAYDLHTGKDAWIEDPHDVESENPLVVSFRENGKRMRIEFADTPRGRLLAEAMRNEGVNRGPEAFDRMTRMWASTATQLSATFSGRNFQKDTVEVALNSAADTGFSGAGKFLKSQIAQLKPVVSTIREYLTKGTFGGPLGNEFKEFVEAGGEIGGIGREGYEDLKDTFSRKAKGLRMAFSGAHGMKEKVEAMLGVTFGKIEDFNKTIELMSRFNNYRSRRAKGESKKEAVIGSREDSTDFNMYGQQRWLNDVYMFSNSILGGTLRSTKQLATGKNGLKVATAVLAYGFIEAAADVLFNRDDDAEAEKTGIGGAKDLSERERSQTLYFRMGGKYFRIPVHGGPFSALKYTGGLLARATLGQLSWGDAVKNAGKEWATIGTHFGGAGEIDLTNGPKGVVNSFTPSVARPIAELGMNQDFAGRHIYAPEGFDKTTPKSERGFRSTGDGYKWFARLMNKVGGGNESRSADWSWFDNPPEAYKHIVEAVGKNMIRDVMLAGDTAGRAVESVTKGENKFTRDDVPFLRDVTRNVPDDSRRYYSAIDEYKRDKAEFKKTTELGRRAEMKKEHPYLSAKKGRVDTLIEQVQELTHRERGEVKVGQKWVPMKTELPEARKEAFRKRRLRLQAEVLRILGK